MRQIGELSFHLHLSERFKWSLIVDRNVLVFCIRDIYPLCLIILPLLFIVLAFCVCMLVRCSRELYERLLLLM